MFLYLPHLSISRASAKSTGIPISAGRYQYQGALSVVFNSMPTLAMPRCQVIIEVGGPQEVSSTRMLGGVVHLLRLREAHWGHGIGAVLDRIA